MEDAPPLTHDTTMAVAAPVHNKPFIVATIIVVASAIKLPPPLTNCHKMLSGIEWKWRKKFKGNLHLSLVNNKSLVLIPVPHILYLI